MVGFIIQGQTTTESNILTISSLEYDILTEDETEEIFSIMVSIGALLQTE